MAMTGLVSTSSSANAASTDITTNVLVAILDLNPYWWGEQLETSSAAGTSDNSGEQTPQHQFPLTSVVDHVLVFLNSYLLIHPNHRVVVLGCLKSKSHFLYPSEETTAVSMSNDSRPELFRVVNFSVQQQIQNILLRSLEENDQTKDDSRESVFVGALSRSLCYIHRIQRDAPKGQNVGARILVVEAGQDSSSHYMHFINAVFTAQKMNVIIDACVLGEDSVLLQQAVDLTNGIYVKAEHPGGIIQILNSIFLLDGDERSKLIVPEKVQVDYRAACFCHQKLIEVGYVCSVCLSVFCAFTPMCSTCQSTFKFMTGTKKRKPADPLPSVASSFNSGAKKTKGNITDTNGRS